MKIKYDKEKLYEILKEFNNVTQIRVSFLENHCTPVVGIPERNCDLCLFKQQDKEFYNRCIECDKVEFENAKKNNDFYIYECHYHLVEVIQPVKINDEVIGYFLFGQILTNKEEFIKKNNPSAKELEYLSLLTTTSIEVLRSYAKILSWVIKYTILNKDIRLQHQSSFEAISSYIELNYNQKITVQSLCKRFCYSRTSLFSLFQKECDMGILEYINKIRLQKAKELLHTNKPNKVAEMVGISDPNYFSRVFKNKFGLTPSQYKEEKRF